MERPSESTAGQVAELRLEFREHANDSQWRHRVLMAELADMQESISRRQSLLGNIDWAKALPIILALAMPVLVLLATGSPEKAIQAVTASSLPPPK